MLYIFHIVIPFISVARPYNPLTIHLLEVGSNWAVSRQFIAIWALTIALLFSSRLGTGTGAALHGCAECSTPYGLSLADLMMMMMIILQYAEVVEIAPSTISYWLILFRTQSD